MALNREDINKVSYKAKIEWYKKRFFKITSDKDIKKEFDKSKRKFTEIQSTPDELIGILGDISKKANKLEKRVDSLSEKLTIPVDKEKNPDIANAIAGMDEESKGEYVSYFLYSSLLEQQKAGDGNIKLDDILENYTGDSNADSLFIQDRISEGFSKYKGIKPPSVPSDNAIERYTNRYLNNILPWNEHDYQIRQILNFSDNYLETFPDPSYIPWYTKRDLVWGKEDINNMSGLWKNFSDAYSGEANATIDGIKNLTALDYNTEEAKTLHDITKKYIENFNTFANGINDVFGFNYSADLLCCFFSWSGRLDLKTLKALRAMMQLLKNGRSFDFKDILNSIKDIINNIFKGIFLNEIIGLINQLIQRIIDPIKKWINNPNPKWKKIFICTPVDELINKYITDSVDHAHELLNKLIINFYKAIELKEIDFELKEMSIKEQKELGTLIEMIDTVISVLEKSAICGTMSSPTGEPIVKIMDSYGIGPEKEYEYQKEENPNIYNSFILSNKPKEESSAGKDIITKLDEGSVGANAGSIGKIKYNQCLRKISPDDVFGPGNWKKDIQNKSNGSTE